MSLLVLAAVVALGGQTPPDRHAATRQALGVASIEAEADSGAEVYRAFFVDGYGRDMPAVAFERRAGAAPVVTVYGAEGQRMSAPVSVADWARVQQEARFAHRELAPLTTARDDVVICLHSWVSTVEIANATSDRGEDAVRRRTEDACSAGLTGEFAFVLAGVAVEAIAPCDTLDTTRQRNAVTTLATCLGLKGDRFTAVSLRNERGEIGPGWERDSGDADLWRASMGTNGSPRLTWAGAEVRTERSRDNRVAEFIVARIAEHPDMRFHQLRFEGVDRRRGVVTGQARYEVDDRLYAAPYVQTWVWDPNLGEWMLESWIVEPFAVVP